MANLPKLCFAQLRALRSFGAYCAALVCRCGGFAVSLRRLFLAGRIFFFLLMVFCAGRLFFAEGVFLSQF